MTPPQPTLAPGAVATDAPDRTRPVQERRAVEPHTDPGITHRGESVALAIFIVVPFIALVAAVPVAWGWGLGWWDVAIAVVMYMVSGLGITVGFHRLFTHRAFKTKNWVRATLAIAGSAAIEGPVISWVADHRKHHAFSDQPGDPHSPHVDHGHGLKGALLLELDRRAEAREAFDRAIALANTAAEADHIRRQIERLTTDHAPASKAKSAG